MSWVPSNKVSISISGSPVVAFNDLKPRSFAHPDIGIRENPPAVNGMAVRAYKERGDDEAEATGPEIAPDLIHHQPRFLNMLQAIG